MTMTLGSSCNDLVHCSWKKRGPKGPGYYKICTILDCSFNEQSNIAAVEPMDELKECEPSVLSSLVGRYLFAFLQLNLSLNIPTEIVLSFIK